MQAENANAQTYKDSYRLSNLPYCGNGASNLEEFQANFKDLETADLVPKINESNYHMNIKASHEDYIPQGPYSDITNILEA